MKVQPWKCWLGIGSSNPSVLVRIISRRSPSLQTTSITIGTGDAAEVKEAGEVQEGKKKTKGDRVMDQMAEGNGGEE